MVDTSLERELRERIN